MSTMGDAFGLAEFEDWWPFVRQRTARACVTNKALSVVRQRCRDGTAICLAGMDGVVVVTPQLHPSGRMRAVVLLAVSTGMPGAFRRQEEAMLEVARELDATELAFATSRPGWGRLLGPQWRFDGEVFCRSV